MSGIDKIWLLFVALAIRSFGAGVQTPTVNALIPNLVEEDKLMKVNGINTTIQSITLIISPAISGAIMPIMKMGNIFLIDVISAIIGILILIFVKYEYKSKYKENEKVKYFENMKEGFKYIKNTPFIKRMLGYYSVLAVLVSPIVLLTSLMVVRSFGSEEWRLTYNEISFFIGSILGGVLISIWGGFKNKINTIILGYLLCRSIWSINWIIN